MRVRERVDAAQSTLLRGYLYSSKEGISDGSFDQVKFYEFCDHLNISYVVIISM